MTSTELHPSLGTDSDVIRRDLPLPTGYAHFFDRGRWTCFGHDTGAREIEYDDSPPVFDLESFAADVVQRDFEMLRKVTPDKPRLKQYTIDEVGRRARVLGEEQIALMARRMAGWETESDIRSRTIEQEAKRIANEKGIEVETVQKFLNTVYYPKVAKHNAALGKTVQAKLRGQRRSFVERNRAAIAEAFEHLGITSRADLTRDAMEAVAEDGINKYVGQRLAASAARQVWDVQLNACFEELIESGRIEAPAEADSSVYVHSQQHADTVRARIFAHHMTEPELAAEC